MIYNVPYKASFLSVQRIGCLVARPLQTSLVIPQTSYKHSEDFFSCCLSIGCLQCIPCDRMVPFCLSLGAHDLQMKGFILNTCVLVFSTAKPVVRVVSVPGLAEGSDLMGGDRN